MGIVIGALLKYFLTEGIGRWYMASGQTILQGWHSIGWWASGYFVVYLLIATFVFGAAISSTCALAIGAMFPDVMPLWAWAVLHAVAAFLIVGIGRYGLFERIMKVFAAFKFGIVILLGVLLAPSLGDLAFGLVPRLPEGSLATALAVVGGVGGPSSLRRTATGRASTAGGSRPGSRRCALTSSPATSSPGCSWSQC